MAEVAALVGLIVGVWVALVVMDERRWSTLRREVHERQMAEIRSQTRSARWAMEEEERARWVREWSLLTMEPPPGRGAPDASPGRQSGSNTVFRHTSNLIAEARMHGIWPPPVQAVEATFHFAPNEWRKVGDWMFRATDPSLSTQPSTPSPSGPRRIGRPPEEMRLSRFLDGGSLGADRSG